MKRERKEREERVKMERDKMREKMMVRIEE